MIQIFSRQKMSLWIWYNSDDEILQDSLKVIDIPMNDRLFYLSVEDPWVILNSHPLLGGKNINGISNLASALLTLIQLAKKAICLKL